MGETSFHARLRQIIGDRKVSDIAFAAARKGIKLPENTIYQYLSGNRRPSLDKIGELADVLEVSADYLLGRDEPEPDPDLPEGAEPVGEMVLIPLYARVTAGEGAEAEARLATVEQQIRLNIQYAASNLLPADMVEEQQRPLIEERERLRARLTEIGAPPALADKDVRWLRDVGTRALEVLRAGDAGRQREFLARIYGQVNLWRDRMEFHHRVPLPPAQVRIPRRYDPSQGLLIDIDDLLL